LGRAKWKEAWKGSRIRAHRRLGRTEWQVSDIVLGTGGISGEEREQIGRLAIERGVNYFDTAPDYSGAASEAAMGNALRGNREHRSLPCPGAENEESAGNQIRPEMVRKSC
jgi:aryl-alcohol dehydrogenase-like predicted oxidoreductase